MINKLSSYKLRIYNSFINSIGPNSHTDLVIYHCDESLFLSLLEKHKTAYDYYVIMPHFKTEDLRHISFTENIIEALKKLPPEKLVILDNIKPEIKDIHFEIYQDFENDIYNALKNGIDKIMGYEKIILVYPEKSIYPYPRRILHGFRKFCAEFKLDFKILNEVFDNMIIKRGDLFITIEESDLVNLVKQANEDEFVLGKDK